MGGSAYAPGCNFQESTARNVPRPWRERWCVGRESFSGRYGRPDQVLGVVLVGDQASSFGVLGVRCPRRGDPGLFETLAPRVRYLWGRTCGAERVFVLATWIAADIVSEFARAPARSCAGAAGDSWFYGCAGRPHGARSPLSGHRERIGSRVRSPVAAARATSLFWPAPLPVGGRRAFRPAATRGG